MERERHDRFAALFVRNQNRVYRYLLTLVPNRADAEELFQQTILTLWETWERFEPTATANAAANAGAGLPADGGSGSDLRGDGSSSNLTGDLADQFVRWACGIAHNHVRNFVRKKQNQQVLVDANVLEQLGAWRLAHEDRLESRRQALAGCLEKLPAGQRSLVERIYAGVQTVQGAAEAAGQTPNAVYKTLNRIRAALYDCITRRLAVEGAT
jgi:RNA polymerase sigma-70 factor (ECF subfamily)